MYLPALGDSTSESFNSGHVSATICEVVGAEIETCQRPLSSVIIIIAIGSDIIIIAVEPEFPLVVTSVVHEAWIKVEEKGTEAAAATAVVIGFAESVPEFDIFTVDRAFLFTIQDDITGSLLFMGRVGNPIE